MRRVRLLRWGVAGVLGAAAAAQGQFAVDRTSPPAPASPPPAAPAQPRAMPFAPIGGAGYQPPAAQPAPVRTVAGFQPLGAPPADGVVQQTGGSVPPAAFPAQPRPQPPAAVEVPSLLAGHPWQLKPEHGAYLILVKAYVSHRDARDQEVGVPPKQLAEELASEIRNTYKMPTYLFEHVSEERKAEMAAKAAAQRQAAPFLQAIEEQNRIAQLRGSDFLPPDTKVRYRTLHYTDQIAVVIGNNFRTDKEARDALDKVRAWKPPQNQRLMDGGAITQAGPDGRPVIQRAYINPFTQAFVVPNPTAPKAAATGGGIDPFVVKLNEGRPYNLLKVAKPWTLSVKTFRAPAVLQSKDEDHGVMGKLFGRKEGEVLQASADQAESLAKSIRGLKDGNGQSLNLEGYVFHTRSGSLVSVGQYDSPNDPLLLHHKQILEGMTFDIKDEQKVQVLGMKQRLFDNVIPLPIPRQ